MNEKCAGFESVLYNYLIAIFNACEHRITVSIEFYTCLTAAIEWAHRLITLTTFLSKS